MNTETLAAHVAAFIVLGVTEAGQPSSLSQRTTKNFLGSVVRQIMRTVKDNLELKKVLGEAIRPQPEWWLNGDPWIQGAVCTTNLRIISVNCLLRLLYCFLGVD